MGVSPWGQKFQKLYAQKPFWRIDPAQRVSLSGAANVRVFMDVPVGSKTA
jgi:hypothetical protein